MSEEKKETRKTRRLKQAKGITLNTLLNLYITERSTLKDPLGDEAVTVFDKYNNMWLKECSNFNSKKNQPIVLRTDAFTKSVEFIMEKEKAEQKKADEEKHNRDFTHWMRREQTARDRMLKYVKRYLFRNLWYKILSFGNKEKTTNKWKGYYGNQLKK